MILRAALALVWVLGFASPCLAGQLRVRIVDEHNAPVVNAVATLTVATPPSGPIHFAWPMRIAQHNMQFDPFVLIAPAGATVAFPNLDGVRHQVYSFSPAGPFELRLYGHDESRSVQFRNVGVIAIGCNIHDQMSAFIYVTSTPFAAKSGADGVAAIADAPAGQAMLTIWHPYSRAANGAQQQSVVLSDADNELIVHVRLHPPPDHAMSY
jgi:plastocyanin